MDCSKLMIALLLFIAVGLTASHLEDDGKTIALSVWVGEEVVLKCGDNSSDTTRRLWKRDDMWLFMNEVIVHNNRVSSVSRSAIMRIVNVTLDDEGYYTCTAFTQPPQKHTVHLQVKEKLCEAPLKPVNGDYEIHTDNYGAGDTIRYHCHKGYQLIGPSNRTCNGTIKGWQPQEPYCQPEYVARVLSRLDDIEDKVTDIEQRFTTLENDTSGIGDKISDRLKRKRVRACTNKTSVDVDEDTVSKCLTMQLGVRDGRSVSEFKWTFKNFHCDHYGGGIYYSEPFYHTVPGYKLRLELTCWKYHASGFGLIVVPSESDDQLTWPFSTRFYLTVLLKDGIEFPYQFFSGQDPTCKFNRPVSETLFNCDTTHYGWRDVMDSNQYWLNDGSVISKIYMYN